MADTPPKFETLGNLPDGLSIALGNFDGLHLGHQAVFQSAAAFGPWAVVSFAPYPRRFFQPKAERFELMNGRTQSRILDDMGAAGFVQIEFDAATAALQPREFLNAITQRFSPVAICTGSDFRFGANRAGDTGLLANWAQEHGIDFAQAEITQHQGEKISSSQIREILQTGHPRDAAQFLGRPHIINGTVIQGDQRGRDLGYPTANLNPRDVMLPKFGIYATRLTIHDGPYAGRYLGASSLGVRPSFGINQPNFETYILDFDGDIYGTEISVELIEYLRGEEKFENLDDLIAQMNRDVAKCRQILGAQTHA